MKKMSSEILKVIKKYPDDRVVWWVSFYTTSGKRALVIRVYRRRNYIMNVKETITIRLE